MSVSVRIKEFLEKNNIKYEHRVHPEVYTAQEVAAVVRARQSLGLQNGLLVTVPVPIEDACDPDEAEEAISQATAEADQAGIHGPAATPWLLRRVVELTAGRSLRANRALLRNNGRVAAQIARALCDMA